MNIQSVIQNFQEKFSEILNLTKERLTIRAYDNTSGVQFTLEEFINQYNPEGLGKGQANFIFSVNVDERAIARFILQDMVNCSGIIVSSDVYIAPKLRNKGLGTLINRFTVDFCTYYGYGIMQATDRDSNEAQKKIFIKNGWNLMTTFKNPKTNNDINVWMYFLNGK